MQIERLWRAPRSFAIGTGLIALDVVLNERRQVEPKLWTGGTCGNVMAILAYLGWTTYPISRMKPDAASRLIHRDLKRWNVNTRYLSLPPTAPTPIVVHRLRRTSTGENFHSFSLHCPDCGTHLPSFRPIPIAAVEAAGVLPRASVFFADRVSPGILVLAETILKTGAVVVFEPSGIGDEQLFDRMLRLAHIVKYSNDRLKDLPVPRTKATSLEIQTMGNGGLRYRSKLAGMSPKEWRNCEAYPVGSLVDTAGAGDWCTAGILHVIGRSGVRGLKTITASRLQDAMKFGQALASWNCRFEGARGGMYEQTTADFQSAVRDILRTTGTTPAPPDTPHVESVRAVAGVCSQCRRDDRRHLLDRLHAAS